MQEIEIKQQEKKRQESKNKIKSISNIFEEEIIRININNFF